ncbi:MAG: hypothetical protein P8046_14435, partial [Anaerolineales bacterium]
MREKNFIWLGDGFAGEQLESQLGNGQGTIWGIPHTHFSAFCFLLAWNTRFLYKVHLVVCWGLVRLNNLLCKLISELP